MILWDSFETDDPTVRDRETLYQIATGSHDLETRHRALAVMDEFPRPDADVAVAEVCGMPIETEADQEIRERAEAMLRA
ncbi:hypothetical protein [Halapricum desulfuricans]|uniref:Uncharacterized protein n=1 Tax=Halapricum desulfuricans TaxID=2841257 RepID=A0A897NTU1_9EURY|nr:hypothetical protein [Halapricum desulfuricans]QSG16322.1 hypothetical protein HSEST_3058 [Halapricum desulfuricans]